jgi:hypothetical protein
VAGMGLDLLIEVSIKATSVYDISLRNGFKDFLTTVDTSTSF